MKIITTEAWKLETQIIRRMLERIGLKARFEVFTSPEWHQKVLIPMLDKPLQEQDWDLAIMAVADYYGHTGTTFLTWPLIEESDARWIEYDPAYEKMWKDMARTVDSEVQEEKIRQMVKYVYDHAYRLHIYSPLMLYAVNKEVNFVPQEFGYLRLKETSVSDEHWSVRQEGER